MGVDIWWYDSRGQWCADVPQKDGGRKRVYLGENEEQARAQLHRELAEYYEDVDTDAESHEFAEGNYGNAVSLVKLAVQFLHWVEDNRAEGTWRGYRDGLKYVTRTYESKLAADLQPGDIEQIKSRMVEEGYASRTINIMIGAAKRMYNWGVKIGKVDENPISGVESVSKHVNTPDSPEDKHLDVKDALRYVEICRESPPLGHFCKFLLLTGMRVGEAVRVTWQDVDFERQILSLEKHKTSGHTNKPRRIPLCQEAIEILKAQWDEETKDTETIFRGDRDQPFTVSALHCRLRRLRKKHKELENLTFHKLRHTCATYLGQQDVPERVAQEILGHSSTLMTRYYTATSRDEMVDAAEKLSEVMSDTRK